MKEYIEFWVVRVRLEDILVELEYPIQFIMEC